MVSNCGGIAYSPAVDRARFRRWRSPGSREEVSGSLLASRRGLCAATVGLGAAEQRGRGGAGLCSGTEVRRRGG